MNRKTGRFWLYLIGTVVLVAVIIGGGFLVYKAGFNRGTISGGAGDVKGFRSFSYKKDFDGYGMKAPHFSPYGHKGSGSYGHMGFRSFFGFGWIILAVLFFFLFLGLIKWLFFPRWGGYWMHGPPGMKHPYKGRWMDEEEVENSKKADK